MTKFSSEREWVAWLEQRHRPPVGGRGIGDDCALLPLRAGWQLAATTDWFLEGVHFRRSERPQDCGYRLAMRALSDLAAMGAKPRALLLSAAWPRNIGWDWRRRLHAGLEQAAREAGAPLIGGDLARASQVGFDIVGLGQIRRGRALLRTGGRPGDRLWVSGWLGYAAWGRQLAGRPNSRRPGQPSAAWRRAQRTERRRAIERWRRPRARWELGQRLSQPGYAHAALDLSDGLSSDLDRLCRASRVGAVIQAERLPAPPLPAAAGNASRLSRRALKSAISARPSRRALALALDGGEDYELLFAAPLSASARLRRLSSAALPLTEIGVLTREPGIWLEENGHRRAMIPRGWDAFRKT